MLKQSFQGLLLVAAVALGSGPSWASAPEGTPVGWSRTADGSAPAPVYAGESGQPAQRASAKASPSTKGAQDRDRYGQTSEGQNDRYAGVSVVRTGEREVSFVDAPKNRQPRPAEVRPSGQPMTADHPVATQKTREDCGCGDKQTDQAPAETTNP